MIILTDKGAYGSWVDYHRDFPDAYDAHVRCFRWYEDHKDCPKHENDPTYW